MENYRDHLHSKKNLVIGRLFLLSGFFVGATSDKSSSTSSAASHSVKPGETY
jgi:hypothetical protein